MAGSNQTQGWNQPSRKEKELYKKSTKPGAGFFFLFVCLFLFFCFLFFFRKINKIDKPFTKLTRVLKNSILMNKIRNEKRNITTEPKEIQSIIRSYYKRLYSTKLENLDEMENFLNRYQVQKLNQDQIKDLNRPISPKEIEAVINSHPNKKKAQDQMGLVPSFMRPS